MKPLRSRLLASGVRIIHSRLYHDSRSSSSTRRPPTYMSSSRARDDSSSTDDDKNDNGNQGRVASKVVQVHNTTGHTDATAQVTSPTQGSSLNNVKTPETDSNVTEKTLNDDVLNKIDKRLIEDRTFPELIHSVFTERWTDFIKVGLPKEERKELIKKFPLPKNCTFLDPPKIN
uniref:Uncharacterized protein n=1 Tax=Trichogramma kaykai TaxID=54128 RepID=A0ABD2VX58_9HYME